MKYNMLANSQRSLIVLNMLITLLGIAILVSGIVAMKIGPTTQGPTAADFEESLRKQIGKPYTEKTHTAVTGLIRNSEDVSTKVLRVLNSHGRIGVEMGTALIITSLMGLVIVLRTSRKKTNTTKCLSSSDH